MAKGKQDFPICVTCKTDIKPIMVATGKRKIVRSCDCGVFDKKGNLLYKWNRD